MLNIGEILKAAGLNFSHVVKTTIFLTDMNNFTHVNEVYGQFLRKIFPAGKTVQVSAFTQRCKCWNFKVIAMRWFQLPDKNPFQPGFK